MSNSTVMKYYLNKDGSGTIFYMGQDGKVAEEKCDNPKTCSKHASLFRGQSNAFPQLNDDVETDSDSVSADSYALQELYDDLTVGKPSNTPENPYTTGPKDAPATCKKCNEELELRTMKWSNDQYDGVQQVWIHKGKPELDFFSNASLNANLNIPKEVSGKRHHSDVNGWCRDCGTVGSVKLEQQAWADVVTCTAPGCGFYRRYSIGD